MNYRVPAVPPEIVLVRQQLTNYCSVDFFSLPVAYTELLTGNDLQQSDTAPHTTTATPSPTHEPPGKTTRNTHPTKHLPSQSLTLVAPPPTTQYIPPHAVTTHGIPSRRWRPRSRGSDCSGRPAQYTLPSRTGTAASRRRAPDTSTARRCGRHSRAGRHSGTPPASSARRHTGRSRQGRCGSLAAERGGGGGVRRESE